MFILLPSSFLLPATATRETRAAGGATWPRATTGGRKESATPHDEAKAGSSIDGQT
jgi:hypothetical protein